MALGLTLLMLLCLSLIAAILIVGLVVMVVSFVIGRLTGHLMHWPALGALVLGGEISLACTPHGRGYAEIWMITDLLAGLSFLAGFTITLGTLYERRATQALLAAAAGFALSLGLECPGIVGAGLGLVVALERRCTLATLALLLLLSPWVPLSGLVTLAVVTILSVGVARRCGWR